MTLASFPCFRGFRGFPGFPGSLVSGLVSSDTCGFRPGFRCVSGDTWCFRVLPVFPVVSGFPVTLASRVSGDGFPVGFPVTLGVSGDTCFISDFRVRISGVSREPGRRPKTVMADDVIRN